LRDWKIMILEGRCIFSSSLPAFTLSKPKLL